MAKKNSKARRGGNDYGFRPGLTREVREQLLKRCLLAADWPEVLAVQREADQIVKAHTKYVGTEIELPRDMAELFAGTLR